MHHQPEQREHVQRAEHHRIVAANGTLEAEQAKFEVGASTSFFVIQYESLLAQSRSTEVAARSSYVKARAALERAMGTILDEHHIAFDAAVRGKM